MALAPTRVGYHLWYTANRGQSRAEEIGLYADKDRADLLAKIIEAPGGVAEGGVPSSAIRSLRGSRSQYDVALKASITQAQLSRLESGDRPLTQKTAKTLAPVLGVSVKELMVSEQISAAQRLAARGKLDPRLLLDTVMEVANTMPDSKVADDLIDAMIAVLKQAMDTYQQTGGATPAAVATKTDRKRPDRDGFGRRVHKPMQGRS